MASPFRFGSRTQQSRAVVAINTPIPDLGGIVISDTNAHDLTAKPAIAIQALAAAVANLTGSNLDGTVTSVPIPVGVTIYGYFPKVTLASGTVIAYYSKD